MTAEKRAIDYMQKLVDNIKFYRENGCDEMEKETQYTFNNVRAAYENAFEKKFTVKRWKVIIDE